MPSTRAHVEPDTLIQLPDSIPPKPTELATAQSLGVPIALFAVTVFVASGLLFLVQPMFARMLLPRLGGSPSAWNACVLFFQATLLLGYLYAHLSTKWLGVRRQTTIHAFVLLLPLLFLPLGAGSATPGDGQNPVWWILQTAAVTIGVPFFVLATSAPLLQRWYAALPMPSARDPYFLYSASNLGSMLALLSYPFVIEPALGVRHQTLVWTSGYILLAALTGICLWMARQGGDGAGDAMPIAAEDAIERTSRANRLRWIVLAFAPSSLMLGVTAHISTDVAAVPLMWVLPLALYLLTFVIAFSQRTHQFPAWPRVLTPPLVLAVLITLALGAHSWWLMPLHLVTFFVSALACHKDLAKARPCVGRLTEFYLWISFGGMLGGIFNALIAPQTFSAVLEYPLVLVLIVLLATKQVPLVPTNRPVLLAYGALLLCGAAWVAGPPRDQAGPAILAATIGISVSVGVARRIEAIRALVLLVAACVMWSPATSAGSTLFEGRSFFGVMRVFESPEGTQRHLRHGSTIHGIQNAPSGGRCEPTSYYHPDGPIGDVMNAFGPRARRVGVVGLGTGAMACYAATGQRWTFYEIDPLMERIARDPALFSYLHNAQGDVAVVIGDGRVKLQEEPPGTFDVIVLDAFSSDSIPVHLLTREAVRLYVSRLKPDGLLAMHISNRYLALEPVVSTIAAQEGLFVSVRYDRTVSTEQRDGGKFISDWMALSSREPTTLILREGFGWRAPTTASRAVWTDDYSNIFSTFR